MSYELEVPPEFKTKLRTGLKWLLFFLFLVLVTVLGHFVSPENVDGRAILLTPRLMQIAAYRREVHAWTSTLKEMDAGLSDLLTNRSTDLFAQDSRISQMRGQLLSLRAEVDGTDVPPTLKNLHTLIGETVDAYFASTLNAAAWIGEPTDANHARALDALKLAGDSLGRIYQNPWVLP